MFIATGLENLLLAALIRLVWLSVKVRFSDLRRSARISLVIFCLPTRPLICFHLITRWFKSVIIKVNLVPRKIHPSNRETEEILEVENAIRNRTDYETTCRKNAGGDDQWSGETERKMQNKMGTDIRGT